MLNRTLELNINRRSWGRRPLPAWATNPTASTQVNVVDALLLLGSVTTPGGLSQGSPERYWACIRYLTACTASIDLRLSMPFLDLDPHQKSILSDDFGVALSTMWLMNQLGGVRNIVDGRRFMINMGVQSGSTSKLPKVGNKKCPDFVVQDLYRKLHVLECKGTQSGRAYLAKAMATGCTQKMGLKVARALRGESLVIGVSLAGDGSSDNSALFVVDPEDPPRTVVEENDAGRVEDVLDRLTIARALNLAGFHRTAFEMAWPENLRRDSPEAELLTEVERRSLSVSHQTRRAAWKREINTEYLEKPGRIVNDFATQKMTFDMPTLRLDEGRQVSRVTVTRGVSVRLLGSLAISGSDMRVMAVDTLRSERTQQSPMKISQIVNGARLDYSGLFFSQIEFDDAGANRQVSR